MGDEARAKQHTITLEPGGYVFFSHSHAYSVISAAIGL